MILEPWHEYYLMAGSAAAVLIGLIFVVVTLMSDRPRSSVLAGSRLYMGPVLLHVAFVLALSAAALTPGMSAGGFALAAAVVAGWGLFRGVQSTVGIAALKGEDAPHWTDAWFYGAIPSVLSLVLAGAAWAVWRGQAWGADGVAAVVAALMLLTVRNEWDLVTWLAPRGEKGEE